MGEVRMECLKSKKKLINLRSTSTENEQRIPLCAFRKVFLGAIRELCVQDGSISFGDDKAEPDQQLGSKSYFSDGNDTDTDDEKKPVNRLRSNSYDKQQWRAKKERQLSWQDQGMKPKVQKLDPQEHRRSFRGIGGSLLSTSSKRGPNSRGRSLRHLNQIRVPLPRPVSHRAESQPLLDRKDSFGSVAENRKKAIPYFAKLCWACEQVGYPHEYADLVGSQFLGLDSANPVTHIDGHVPLVTDLVEFVAQAFMTITNFADLIVVFIDDFQWVDSFTWKVIRALGQSGKKMLLICAMRSHDKQALRRIQTAVNFRLEITLGPLNLPGIKELFGVLGYDEGSIDEQLCTDIYQRTGGVPVYVIELLELIKRSNSVSQNEEGMLRLTNDGQLGDVSIECHVVEPPLKIADFSFCYTVGEKRGKGSSALAESLLNRFDRLGVRVRKILQTCAVLGNSFALSDLVRVHPEISEGGIEQSLEIATSEMILGEIVEDDDDTKSIFSNSTGGSSSKIGSSIEFSKTSSGINVLGDRFFEFSHDMWRSSVLTTMLKERKIELHRLIAEAMEQDQKLVLQRSDIGRLLTLFDHWKSCGDFRRAAPLALVVGIRLNEWDLVAQSLDLYHDALDMCFDSVQPVEERHWRSDGKLIPAIVPCIMCKSNYPLREDDWVKVASNPEVLDLILRLHVTIAESHRLMDDLRQCATTLQDAYTVSVQTLTSEGAPLHFDSRAFAT
jgi:hypothetical protein